MSSSMSMMFMSTSTRSGHCQDYGEKRSTLSYFVFTTRYFALSKGMSFREFEYEHEYLFISTSTNGVFCYKCGEILCHTSTHVKIQEGYFGKSRSTSLNLTANKTITFIQINL